MKQKKWEPSQTERTCQTCEYETQPCGHLVGYCRGRDFPDEVPEKWTPKRDITSRKIVLSKTERICRNCRSGYSRQNKGHSDDALKYCYTHHPLRFALCNDHYSHFRPRGNKYERAVARLEKKKEKHQAWLMAKKTRLEAKEHKRQARIVAKAAKQCQRAAAKEAKQKAKEEKANIVSTVQDLRRRLRDVTISDIKKGGELERLQHQLTAQAERIAELSQPINFDAEFTKWQMSKDLLSEDNISEVKPSEPEVEKNCGNCKYCGKSTCPENCDNLPWNQHPGWAPIETEEPKMEPSKSQVEKSCATCYYEGKGHCPPHSDGKKGCGPRTEWYKWQPKDFVPPVENKKDPKEVISQAEYDLKKCQYCQYNSQPSCYDHWLTTGEKPFCWAFDDEHYTVNIPTTPTYQKGDDCPVCKNNSLEFPKSIEQGQCNECRAKVKGITNYNLCHGCGEVYATPSEANHCPCQTKATTFTNRFGVELPLYCQGCMCVDSDLYACQLLNSKRGKEYRQEAIIGKCSWRDSQN